MENYKPVRALCDGDGHWYLIPAELFKEFRDDEDNWVLIENGEFDAKWGKYMTGGDLNLVQLYIKTE